MQCIVSCSFFSCNECLSLPLDFLSFYTDHFANISIFAIARSFFLFRSKQPDEINEKRLLTITLTRSRENTNQERWTEFVGLICCLFCSIETSLGKKDSGFSSATDATEQQRQIRRKDEQIEHLNNQLKERDDEIQRLANELKR